MKIICGEIVLKNDPRRTENAIKYVDLVVANWDKKRPGYRDGVFLVPLPPETFKSNIVKLVEDDYLFGRYEKRVQNEEPRKKMFVLERKVNVMELLSVDAVVYSRETLAEGNENTDPTADFEIVAILKKVVAGDQPMPVDTMLYNYFKANGGTDMKCSPEEFVNQLKESFEFWKDKAVLY